MVWFLGQDSGEMYDYGGIDALDGDWRKVQPIDASRDDGIPIVPTCSNQGRPLDTAFMPTRIRVNGPKRDLVDVLPGYSSLLVDQRFKDAVEALEPGVHQFFPIALEWKDGSPAGSRYWFNPCSRIDSIDREQSTKRFRNKWKQAGPGEFVFNRDQIGDRHVWIDKFVSGNRPFLTDTLKARLDESGTTGLLFEHHYREVD